MWANVTRSRGLRAAALCLPLLILSCAPPPQYDQQTDAQLTALQKEVDSRIVQFISDGRAGDAASLKQGGYAQNIDWYNNVDSDMTSVEMRMEAIPDPSTANLPAFFDNLRTELAAVRKDHQAKGNLSPIVWIVTRSQLNAQFAVLLTYELSLKKGGSPGATSSTATATAAAKAAAPASK